MRALSSEFPLSTLCRALGVSRSSASYERRVCAVRDLTGLKRAITTFRVTYRSFGVKRMHALLRRLEVHASRSDVRRAYAELGILKKRSAGKVRTTHSSSEEGRFPNLVRNLEIDRPDQVWVADVTYVRVGSRPVYLALLMDVYTRRIVGWALECFLGEKLALSALEAALDGGNRPQIHHSDRDCGYTADAYVNRLRACKTRISMTAPATPKENGYAERLNRTVKEEEVYLGEYQTLGEARDSIGAFIRYYNELRIHSSLKYQTPSEVLQRWIDEHRRRE